MTSPLVDELVVTGAAGPPWWRVSDGDTTLYIIADPGPIPDEVEWSKARLQGRVERANALILPPDLDIGLGVVVAAPKAFFQYQKLRKKGDKLEPSLDAPVRARFVAAREKIGRPARATGPRVRAWRA